MNRFVYVYDRTTRQMGNKHPDGTLMFHGTFETNAFGIGILRSRYRQLRKAGIPGYAARSILTCTLMIKTQDGNRQPAAMADVS